MENPSEGEIREVVRAFLSVQSWRGMKQIIENQQDILLSDAVDHILLGLIKSGKDNNEDTFDLQNRLTLLTSCRSEGIDAAFAVLLTPVPIPPEPPALVIRFAPDTLLPSQKPVADAVMELIHTGKTWSEKKRIIEAQHETLLTDSAHMFLAELLLQFTYDPEVGNVIRIYHTLLALCYNKGIIDAFAPLLLPHGSQQLFDLVLDFINMDVRYAKQLLKEWSEILLSDEAMQAILLIQQKNKHNTEAFNRIKDRYNMLERCRREGIVAVFPDHLANISENMFETLASFLNAETIEEQKRIIEDRQEEMFSIAFDLLLTQVIEVYKKKDDLGTVHKLRACRVMIERCRRMGIATGIAELMTSEYFPHAELVLSFINTPSSEAQKRIVEEHHDVLFAGSVNNFIIDLLVHN